MVDFDFPLLKPLIRLLYTYNDNDGLNNFVGFWTPE